MAYLTILIVHNRTIAITLKAVCLPISGRTKSSDLTVDIVYSPSNPLWKTVVSILSYKTSILASDLRYVCSRQEIYILTDAAAVAAKPAREKGTNISIESVIECGEPEAVPVHETDKAVDDGDALIDGGGEYGEVVRHGENL